MIRLLTLILFSLFLSIRVFASEVVVEVSGVEDAWLDEVKASISLYQQGAHPLLNELLVSDLHRKAPDEIKKALQSYGYYQAQVRGELSKEEGQWTARYQVELGARVIVSKLDVQIEGEAKEDALFRTWLADIPLRVGEPLDHRLYETTKNQLLSIAEDHGYFDGAFTEHQVLVSVSSSSAEVVIHYDSGRRFLFGEITFRQIQSIVSEGFLKRFVAFSPGDPYQSNQIYTMQRALLQSNYFEGVDIRPRRDLAEQYRIPIEVTLTPRKRNLYTWGIGYGTDTLYRTSIGFERRWVNQEGHRFNSGIQLSGIGKEALASYTIPLKRALSDFIEFSPSWEQERTDSSERMTRKMDVRLGTLLYGWMQTLSITYEQERYTVANEYGKSLLLVPGVSWQRTVADDRLQPNRGWSLFLQVRGGAETLGSDISFLQLRSSVKSVLGLGHFGRLLTRLDVGASEVPAFNELPPSYRFFAGGDYSVRGYGYKSLGPTDSQGQVIGGQNLLVGSVEYNFPIRGILEGAVFYDAGNAFDDLDINAQQGAGFGLRWRLPIGAIRVDLASALSKQDQPWRFHLTIGMEL